MKIYRVYESFHDPSESGTNEFGYYSTLELAKARVAEVWKVRGYSSEYTEYENGGRYAPDGWGSGESISVTWFELDKPLDDKMVGYT